MPRHLQAEPLGSNAVGAYGIPNATTPPTTNPTGGALLWSEGGVVKVRQSDGTVFTVGIPANMVTTDTVQTVTAKKTFTAAPQIGNSASSATHATLGARGTLLGFPTGTYIADNLTFDGTDWRYIQNGLGAIMVVSNGQFIVYRAITGIAGAIASLIASAATLTSDVINTAAFGAAGLTGATAGARFVGATASAAPVSGNFVVGDFVVARNGRIWICTVAGTPGTWTDTGTSANMVTTDTTQTVTGEKNFSAAGNIFGGRAVSLLASTTFDTNLFVQGFAAQTTSIAIFKRNATQTGNLTAWSDENDVVLSRVSSSGQIFENGNRVLTTASVIDGGSA